MNEIHYKRNMYSTATRVVLKVKSILNQRYQCPILQDNKTEFLGR